MGYYKSLIPGIKRNISIINQIGSVTKPMIKMIKPGSKMTKRNLLSPIAPFMGVCHDELINQSIAG
jgi:hypothetical protein